MKDTFCPVPWVFQAIRSNGDIRVCCQSNVSKNKGILRKKDESPYNAGNDTLSDSRNSALMKNIRKNMLSGKWNPSCIRCFKEEKSNLTSRRKNELQYSYITLETAKKITSKEGSIDTEALPVLHYDLRFGNLCNLACRMCGPTDSSHWYKDWILLNGTKVFYDTHGPVSLKQKGEQFVTSSYNWHYKEKFWQQIQNNLPNIRHIYMAGGEPLMIKRHYDFIQCCIDQGHAKNIKLEYNTNCAKLPSLAVEKWKHFKRVYIGASIDGYGKYVEYQRHPVKWDTLHKNLKTLNNMPGNIMTWIAYTITIYNILHFPDFMKWKLKSGLKNINNRKDKPIVTHHMAHEPQYLNIKALPEQLKKKAERKLNDFSLWVKNSRYPEHIIKSADKITGSVIDYMYAENFYPAQWGDFLEWTKKLDKIRGEDFLNIEPSFKDFYTHWG